MLTTSHARSAIASRATTGLVIVSSRQIGVRSRSARRAWSSSASGASGCSSARELELVQHGEAVGVGQRVAPVGVGLQHDVGADCGAYGGDRVDVVARARSSA